MSKFSIIVKKYKNEKKLSVTSKNMPLPDKYLREINDLDDLIDFLSIIEKEFTRRNLFEIECFDSEYFIKNAVNAYRSTNVKKFLEQNDFSNEFSKLAYIIRIALESEGC